MVENKEIAELMILELMRRYSFNLPLLQQLLRLSTKSANTSSDSTTLERNHQLLVKNTYLWCRYISVNIVSRTHNTPRGIRNEWELMLARRATCGISIV